MDKRPCAAQRLALRRAGPHDARALAGFRAASHAERDGVAGASVERFRAQCTSFFVRELTSESGFLHVWLALDNERPIGAAALTVVPTLPRFSAKGEDKPITDGRVRDVYVVPEYRSRGIGRQLVIAVIAEAKVLGVDRLTLGASSPGRPLYASLGFVDKRDEMVYVEKARPSP